MPTASIQRLRSLGDVLTPEEHGIAHIDYDGISTLAIIIFFPYTLTIRLIDVIRSSQELEIPLFYVSARRMPITMSATIEQSRRRAGARITPGKDSRAISELKSSICSLFIVQSVSAHGPSWVH